MAKIFSFDKLRKFINQFKRKPKVDKYEFEQVTTESLQFNTAAYSKENNPNDVYPTYRVREHKPNGSTITFSSSIGHDKRLDIIAHAGRTVGEVRLSGIKQGLDGSFDFYIAVNHPEKSSQIIQQQTIPLSRGGPVNKTKPGTTKLTLVA